MASSSTSQNRTSNHSSVISRSVLLDIEAEESDAAEDEMCSDDEVTAAERARQAAESVPLRGSDYVPDVLRVANAWEKIALERESNAVSSRNKAKRKADSSQATPRKRPREDSPLPPPPPNHSLHYVDTCKRRKYFYIEDIPGETVKAREFRIYDAGEVFVVADFDEDYAELRAKQKAARQKRAEDQASTQATSSGNSDVPAHPSAVLFEEPARAEHQASTQKTSSGKVDAPAQPSAVLFDEEPARDPTPVPQTPLGQPKGPTRVSSISSDPRVTEGWNIVQKMLDNHEMTLDVARKELEDLFGTDGNPEIWNTISTLNDLDPDERQEGEARIALLLKEKLGKNTVATNADVEMQSPSVEDPQSGDPRVTEGWNIVQKMIDNHEMTLDDARKELEELFGTDGNPEIWNTISTLNDLDPDERQEGEARIALLLKEKLGKNAVATNADVEMKSPSVEDPQSGEEMEQDHSALLEPRLQEHQLLARLTTRSSDPNALDYQVFSLACRRGSELDAYDKISADIETGRVHPDIVPYVFKSRYPGHIYILASSMLPKHARLAAYLRTVPGLIYSHWYRITFPGETAWSRQNEKIKKPPRVTLEAHDLHMPIHLRIQDVFFDDEAVNDGSPLDGRTDVFRKQFVAGTWVAIKTGRYRRDLGIIVNDDFKWEDRSCYVQLIVIPRIKYPGSSRGRPPKVPLPIDFTLSPEMAWRSFIVTNNVNIRATCIKPDCSTGWVCNHQKNTHKRYRVFGQTVRGGFVLLEVNYHDLELASRVPDRDLAVFKKIAGDGRLGRIPPLSSWIFQEKETVMLVHSHIPVALPGMHWKEDMGNATDGAEGIIQKVDDMMCEVAFQEHGEIIDVRSVGYHHLVKKLAIGQTVRLGPGVRPLKEIQWVQRGESGVLTMEEKQLELANAQGLISRLYIHPLHGPSATVWIQALSLLVALDPNSLLDASYSLALSSGSSPHPAFANNALIPSHTATCDIRDVFVIERNHLQVVEKELLRGQNLHPVDWFAQISFRKSLRVPWLGVRVTVDRKERPDRIGFRGEVIDIARDTENTDHFFVLIRWNHDYFEDHFDWFSYDEVRRLDNHGLLHEFTPYSGTSPWKGVKVKVVKQGVYKDREGEVQDARADLYLDKDTVSGISIQIRFQDGILFGESRTGWIDYHYVRRCDTRPMRFLHEGSVGINGSKSYYTFKLGYLPVYSAEEVAAWDSAPGPRQDASAENPISIATSSPYFTFQATWDSSSPEPDIPANFWILDRRIWQTLQGREIYVACANRPDDLRVSIKHLGTGAITFEAHESRKGTRNQKHLYQQVHPGVISNTPWSHSIKRNEGANGLYIICDLEPHTGKLARRVRMSKSISGEERDDLWLLQPVVWALPPSGLDHTEALAQEPFIRTTKDHFVQVHETVKTADRANEMMCRLRYGEQAPLNGYMINEDDLVVKEVVRRGRQHKA